MAQFERFEIFEETGYIVGSQLVRSSPEGTRMAMRVLGCEGLRYAMIEMRGREMLIRTARAQIRFLLASLRRDSRSTG
ncbi:hypothetical protein SCHPADRAFT_906727 [Schizopora paradoxa]|uniref:Uncharacterized protein n=1 Tax=Schizopora paradoxa TaxID=27342 RepID=A0A0H2RFJ8_9AGAM|nr:hypothetical protein SCHPADRAFT_906727 [Schizopora paradoxa]